MKFSPASRLTDRQILWVAYRNDGTQFNYLNAPVGRLATTWAAHFAEVFDGDVIPVTFN